MFSFGSDYYGKTAIPMTINSAHLLDLKGVLKLLKGHVTILYDLHTMNLMVINI